MKKQLITLCLTAFTYSACQQEDLPLAKSIETQEQNTFRAVFKWKKNSLYQKFWHKIRGKDVSKENYFDSKKRAR